MVPVQVDITDEEWDAIFPPKKLAEEVDKSEEVEDNPPKEPQK
jgi:hypothetical protein